MALAAVRSAVIYSLFSGAPSVCVVFVLGSCFVMQYCVFFLILQSSRWRRESRLVYFCGILNVMFLLSFFALLRDAVGWSVVCD